tara:strand:+ start:543 stop:830 length:288 start_codon:yes stop_codon:yes gene_type:complete
LYSFGLEVPLELEELLELLVPEELLELPEPDELLELLELAELLELLEPDELLELLEPDELLELFDFGVLITFDVLLGEEYRTGVVQFELLFSSIK